jgi:hypothetical protein
MKRTDFMQMLNVIK